MAAQTCIEVIDQSQVGEARRAAVKAAQAADMNDTRCGEVAIVATELATNLVRYAEHGRLLIQPLTTGSSVLVELLAIDSGPGIANISRCLSDGYSSGGTPGTGLGAVRRLSAEFDAYSTPGRGTVMMARLRASTPDIATRARFSIGAVSVPAPGEVVCGDAWRLAEKGDELAIMVADGLGHGPHAAEAAARVSNAFAEDPFSGTDVFFQRAHHAAHGSRGAAVACCHINSLGEMRYSGVGNIAGTLMGLESRRGLPTQNGTVGVEMRQAVAVAPYQWQERGLLVMHSDGLTSRWTLDTYPGLLVRHPAIVAGVLYRDFLRGRDDATVVVIGAAGTA